jgi:hypothetical protein
MMVVGTMDFSEGTEDADDDQNRFLLRCCEHSAEGARCAAARSSGNDASGGRQPLDSLSS